MSPSHTPRSSDKYRSSDSNGNSNSKHDRDKGVNIQVLVRCRPLSEDEKRMSTPVVITCNEIRREVSATQNIANKQIDKTFVFDKVFGPDSRQTDLFDHAVVPIVNEVLDGYNCTIFAYGQTGTGKTYTMEGGGRKGKNGELPSDAGVIPRAVRQIFDVLEAQSAEYSMKVTFLELYNEEITDLLAPEESKFSDDKSKKPLALMEDGKGGVFVRGLEEEIVSSAGEIYKILDKGSARRRTAETLLNKQSSRSHSIFSITIHIKECTPEGEEMIKCGKLNLVDLAGSENISRSGAREGRAREAGEINKSLLTLGRVINTLVEHSGHIPYRDSKLTRLLRDSLGGKTKTCIIATISPSIHCLEETLNTLDYAHRAKTIKNKPEVNQKMMKSALIKDLYSEIDRLKQEVYAAREKNGVYIPRDRYLLEEAEKKATTEKLERMEIDLESKEKQLVELHDLHNSQKALSVELRDKLEKTQRKLEDTEHTLSDTEQRYRQAISTIKEKEYLISNLLKSEKALVGRACDLRTELENVAADVSGLFSKIERKDKIEDANKNLVHQFHAQLTQHLDLLHRTVSDSVMQQENQLKEMEEGMQSFVSKKVEATEELRGCVGKLREMYGFGIRSLDDLAGELAENSRSTFGKLNSLVVTHSSSLEDCFQGIALEADNLLNELQSGLFKQEEKLSAFARQQREQLVELHDLHNSQKALSVELRDKLEKTQRKLEDTEHTLSDTEQRYRQAISTIKEKEYLISNLLKSEKALVGRACDLRTELENVAADVSGLFSKIERKDKIEDANKNLVHQFHAQLTQHLDLLHRTVSDSVMQQENQLKEMEEGMQSFVSKKVEATEELRGCVGKLREMYGFGIRSLDDLAGELAENSRSTFGKLNSLVVTHSSSLEDCFQGIALEADNLLNELQSGLFKQEEKLSAFARQQREGFVRAVETTRSISKITTDFFQTLDVHASKLNKILEESQTVHDQKLFELEKKFEECAATEERQLLEKVAEMLASSSARKKTLIIKDQS
ncbi:kinesin-like protein KIN-5A [Cocos nucifera]|uniref:Kinesin-like protein KIN-5A n=1 Tax=Cocos nucifera TaxID=13894 RepID=A0A8K0MZD9_COCNU|nr:kinesin-like protein KIN-5A [Cocos nucifera]